MDKKIKTSRSSQTREKTARRQPWRPPSRLDAPEPPAGFQYRWIRAEVMGQEDKKNVASRMREGYEPVRLEELGDFEAPTVEDGTMKGVVSVGGLLLAKIPKEIVDERNEYFRHNVNGIEGCDEPFNMSNYGNLQEEYSKNRFLLINPK